MRTWNRRNAILLLERLELYVSAGLPLDQTLRVIVSGASRKEKRSLEPVLRTVEAGGRLSEALRKSVGLSPMLSGLIGHGESSGALAVTLGMARSLLEREDELLKKCLSAMAYPTIIALFAGLLTIGLVRGIMPQIIPMLLGLHVGLPLLTRIVIFISENMIAYGLPFLGIISLGLTSLAFMYRKVTRARLIVHVILSRIPIVGRLARMYSLSVFMQSCGGLVESGLSLPDAYVRTARTVFLLPLRRRLESRTNDLRRGASMMSVITFRGIPAHVPPLVGAGEASGTLGSSLRRAAMIIDRDIEHALKRLTSLIEPLMMVAMGGVVGSIALSIMMPIYDISKVLQK